MLVLILTGLILAGRQDAAADTGRLVQIVDEPRVARCMGSMVGFSNVPLRCVVNADATLGNCEVLSTNRTALRYSRVFRCMASNVRVYNEDGSPAVGRSVATRINGRTVFSDPNA